MAMPNISQDDVELRCRGGLAGIVRNGLLEVKCRHWACTNGGNVTFHYYDLVTGKLVDTKQYKDPNKEKNK
jgi:hypothetical protein